METRHTCQVSEPCTFVYYHSEKNARQICVQNVVYACVCVCVCVCVLVCVCVWGGGACMCAGACVCVCVNCVFGYS